MTIRLEEGWITVVLLAALMTVSSWGVIVAGWTDYLWATWPAALIAIGAGLALAKSRFTGIQATVFAFTYGLFVVGYLLCLNLSGDWHERSVELVVRLNNFLYRLLYGGTNRDTLPFPVVVALLYWVMGAAAAWAIFRRGQAWTAVIPGGVGLFINTYYYLGPVQLDWYLAVYVLLGLLLVARMSLLAREREWRAARVSFNPEMRFDFLRAGLMVALFGVMVGWAGPELAASPAAADVWQEVSGPLAVVRESWMRLFASIRSRGQTVNDFYGDSLTLGGPTLLSDAPIMDVALVSPEDQAAPDSASAVARFYWRATAHDTYTDGRWTSDNSSFKEFDPDKQNALRLPPYQMRRDVQLAFRSFVTRSSRLYVAPQPKLIDRPVSFEIMETPGGAVDVSTVIARDILHAGQSYQIVSSVSVADIESLQKAGDDYPEWVTQYFLQYPDSITDRTRALARQIVADAGARTPYDQAQAITDWLRANIRYDAEVDAPPQSVEPVDWFLFTSRTGYCNYYASAQVIMLRTLGIPARLAVGFSQGQFAPEISTYHVLEKNAHAWPEVYFPQYGWVEFEPTASEPPLERPERREIASTNPAPTPDPNLADGPEPTPIPSGRETEDEDQTTSRSSALQLWLVRAGGVARQAGLGLLGVVALAALLIILGIRAGLLGWENLGRVGRWVLRARKQIIPSLISLAYLNLERAAHWMGLKLGEALTPHERASAIGQAVPQAQDSVTTIAAEYVTERYSPRPAESQPQAAWAAWRGIRWQMWREALRGYLRTWTEDNRSARQQQRLNKN